MTKQTTEKLEIVDCIHFGLAGAIINLVFGVVLTLSSNQKVMICDKKCQAFNVSLVHWDLWFPAAVSPQRQLQGFRAETRGSCCLDNGYDRMQYMEDDDK